jgi:hypothetical protein
MQSYMENTMVFSKFEPHCREGGMCEASTPKKSMIYLSIYLGPRIQNGLISMTAVYVKKESCRQVENGKIFFTDCTSDLSHQEQISLVLRYSVVNTAEVKVIENFIGIIPVQGQIGKWAVRFSPGFSKRIWPSY